MFKKIKVFLEMIKFEHSIFALPFAYLGLFLASDGLPNTRTFWWVTLAMVSMRTAAMCLNRLIDQRIDEENPRTQNRALPKGLLTRQFVRVAAVISIALFVFSAGKLNDLCLALSPIPISLAFLYPFTKRWTALSHLVLGFTLGIAPTGAWIAVRSQIEMIPLLLTLAVTSWVAGFDIFYSLQDVKFDREKRLHSVPVLIGEEKAVLIAKLAHGMTVGALIVAGAAAGLGVFYWVGILLVAGFIVREHWLIRKFGLAKIDEAFFNMNAWVSVVVFIAVFLDLMV